MVYLRVTPDCVFYPYTLADLRRDHPTISFPRILSLEDLATFGIYAVTPVDPPHASMAQGVIELTPVKIGGGWYQSWETYEVSPEEIAARHTSAMTALRAERDARLAACDWTQGRDIPAEIAHAWAAYRMLLRGLPDSVDAPFSVLWPDAPALEVKPPADEPAPAQGDDPTA